MFMAAAAGDRKKFRRGESTVVGNDTKWFWKVKGKTSLQNQLFVLTFFQLPIYHILKLNFTQINSLRSLIDVSEIDSFTHCVFLHKCKQFAKASVTNNLDARACRYFLSRQIGILMGQNLLPN